MTTLPNASDEELSPPARMTTRSSPQKQAPPTTKSKMRAAAVPTKIAETVSAGKVIRSLPAKTKFVRARPPLDDNAGPNSYDALQRSTRAAPAKKLSATSGNRPVRPTKAKLQTSPVTAGRINKPAGKSKRVASIDDIVMTNAESLVKERGPGRPKKGSASEVSEGPGSPMDGVEQALGIDPSRKSSVGGVRPSIEKPKRKTSVVRNTSRGPAGRKASAGTGPTDTKKTQGTPDRRRSSSPSRRLGELSISKSRSNSASSRRGSGRGRWPAGTGKGDEEIGSLARSAKKSALLRQPNVDRKGSRGSAPPSPSKTKASKGSGPRSGTRSPMKPTPADQGLPAGQPSAAGHGTVRSKTNDYSIGGDPIQKINPFFEPLPAQEVWHRRMPPFFPFGEGT